ncbi:MerR family transcriptional regulator [Paucibacter soli]|uniref:MerR family transcriptional regulator n=1 Tax=Paucibacter soli TaxID=3133433 RepID=UPI0030B7C8B1
MAEPAPAGLPGIAAVERETGLSKDTLRIWERRYGFPAPLRDAQDERVYPPEQVEKLRLLKRLLDAGHRPGRVVPADREVLQALLTEAMQRRSSLQAKQGQLPAETLVPYLDLLQSHRVEDLSRLLAQAIVRMGLGAAVLNLIAPLTTQVGELWMRGELAVFEEHVYSECLQRVLRQAIQAVPRQALNERPRVLLSTLPGEAHGLGLLMAEAMLTIEGCQCLSLGVQTPLADIPHAVQAHASDIVALSFSNVLPASAVQESLQLLRAMLPPTVALWAGGSGSALQRHAVDGVQRVTQLAGVAAEVQHWRAASS